MLTFKHGDRVISNLGSPAIVLSTCELVTVLFEDSSVAVLPASEFKPKRKFSPGQYVRVVSTDNEFPNEVGIVFEDDGDDEENMPYSVGIYDAFDSENNFSASELIPWLPEVDERVVTVDDEDEFGTVVSIDGDFAVVDWDDYPGTQTWRLSELEPADEADRFEVDDEVDYVNPFFTDPKKAIVIATEGDSLTVHFPESPSMDGTYDKEFFSNAA